MVKRFDQGGISAQSVRALFLTSAFVQFLRFDVVAEDAQRGTVSLRLPFDHRYTIVSDLGHYHGGVIAAFVDIAASMCCVMATGTPTPTVDLRIDYLRSPRNVDLIADAKMWKAGRSIATADVVIRDADGITYALGRGAFSVSNSKASMFPTLPAEQEGTR
ncbi:MAG TPA: PaaI family thioesterase [Steroidobacter sp.]|uniref:PaaI family thioesterase n=1 Tax=Steroidobacter sp. TaxID=1978227 RepID=UPI002ED849F6